MTIEDYTYRSRILLSLNNKVIYFLDGSFRDQVEWFNQEDLLRTMRGLNKGMDKPRLRDFLEDLTELKLVDKREGKKQEKSQSKGEYKISILGHQKLISFNQLGLH